MELTKDQQVKELKSQVYDMLAQVEQHQLSQNQLKEMIGKKNKEIYDLLNTPEPAPVEQSN